VSVGLLSIVTLFTCDIPVDRIVGFLTFSIVVFFVFILIPVFDIVNGRRVDVFVVVDGEDFFCEMSASVFVTSNDPWIGMLLIPIFCGTFDFIVVVGLFITLSTILVFSKFS